MTARCALTVPGARWSDRASQVVDLGTARCSRIAARDRADQAGQRVVVVAGALPDETGPAGGVRDDWLVGLELDRDPRPEEHRRDEPDARAVGLDRDVVLGHVDADLGLGVAQLVVQVVDRHPDAVLDHLGVAVGDVRLGDRDHPVPQRREHRAVVALQGGCHAGRRTPHGPIAAAALDGAASRRNARSPDTTSGSVSPSASYCPIGSWMVPVGTGPKMSGTHSQGSASSKQQPEVEVGSGRQQLGEPRVQQVRARVRDRADAREGLPDGVGCEPHGRHVVGADRDREQGA